MKHAGKQRKVTGVATCIKYANSGSATGTLGSVPSRLHTTSVHSAASIILDGISQTSWSVGLTRRQRFATNLVSNTHIMRYMSGHWEARLCGATFKRSPGKISFPCHEVVCQSPLFLLRHRHFCHVETEDVISRLKAHAVPMTRHEKCNTSLKGGFGYVALNNELYLIQLPMWYVPKNCIPQRISSYFRIVGSKSGRNCLLCIGNYRAQTKDDLMKIMRQWVPVFKRLPTPCPFSAALEKLYNASLTVQEMWTKKEQCAGSLTRKQEALGCMWHQNTIRLVFIYSASHYIVCKRNCHKKHPVPRSTFFEKQRDKKIQTWSNSNM